MPPSKHDHAEDDEDANDDETRSLHTRKVQQLTRDTSEERMKPLQIPWSHKISRFNISLTCVVIAIIPASIGFLVFLWSQSSGGNVSGTFRTLVLDGMVVQAVTITSVVLRFAVSTSAGIATSMLASLALEIRGTNIRSAPGLSILRFVNGGPHNLDSGFLVGPLQIGTTNSGISNGNLDLAGLSTTVSLTPREFPLFGELHTPDESLGDDSRGTGTLLRTLLPITNSSTRESVRKFSGMTTLIDSKVTCVRPRADEEHTVLYDVVHTEWLINGTWAPESFPIGLMDTPRYPIPIANIDYFYLDIEQNPVAWDRYSNTFYDVTNNGNQPHAYAEMSNLYDEGVYSLTLWETKYVLPVGSDDGKWTLSLMPLKDGPALLSSLDPRFPVDEGNFVPWEESTYPSTRMPYFAQDDPIQLLTGTSYLVINITNGRSADIPAFRSESGNLTNNNVGYLFATYEDGFADLVTSPQETSLVFSIPALPGWEASVSLCYDSFTTFNLAVDMVTETALTEPNFSPFDVQKRRFGAEQVEAQLDYNKNIVLRGVMSIDTLSAQLQEQTSQFYQDTQRQNLTVMNQTFITYTLRDLLEPESFYILCPNCTSQNTNPSNKADVAFGNRLVTAAIQQIFMDHAQQDGDIPLALSSYLTTEARTVYYDALAYFDIADQSSMSHFEGGTFPRRFTGLATVLAVLAVHLAIVATVTVLFLRNTYVTRIGDAAWQVISQVQSDDMKYFLTQSTMLPDVAVDKMISSAGMKEVIMTLGSQAESERVGLMRRRQVRRRIRGDHEMQLSLSRP